MPRPAIKQRQPKDDFDITARDAANALMSGPAGAADSVAAEAGRWKSVGSRAANKIARFGRGVGKIATQGFSSIANKGTAAGGDTSDVDMGPGFRDALSDTQTKNANSQYRRSGAVEAAHDDLDKRYASFKKKYGKK